MDPHIFRVELFANSINGGEPTRQPMELVAPWDASTGSYIYRAEVAATRPASDYTPRLYPVCAGAAVPLEGDLILWQR
ncbi:MAG TPA: hypothetical protein VMA13_01925 [Candidatus Saccharimonadales bacterium]|nr:hypothetical protein [Candidatus Saccharimonadales bacterium]